MNCGGLRRILTGGGALSKDAEEHLRSCAGCQAMLDVLDASAAPSFDIDAPRLKQLQEIVTVDLKRVRPLPRDRVLIPGLTILLLTIAVAASLVAGYKGFLSLTLGQLCAYYGVIVVAIWVVSYLAVTEAIPGSRRVPHAYGLIALCLAALSLTVSLLFHDFHLNRFVSLGWPCLALGSAAGLITALLLWKLINRGFFSEPIRSGVLVSALCGLTGIAFLAIHCPLRNSLHILVWHLGVVLLAMGTGAVIAISQDRR